MLTCSESIEEQEDIERVLDAGETISSSSTILWSFSPSGSDCDTGMLGSGAVGGGRLGWVMR